MFVHQWPLCNLINVREIYLFMCLKETIGLCSFGSNSHYAESVSCLL